MSGRSKTLTWGLPTLGVVTLIGGATLVMLNRPVSAEEAPPREPTTAPQLSGDIEPGNFIGAIGVSEPAGEALRIASLRAGVVVEVPIEVGQSVAAGGVLFRLDARLDESEVALRQQEVAVALAETTALRADIPARVAALAAAESAVRSAQAQVEAAQAEYDDRQNQQRVAESIKDTRAIAAEELDRRRFAAAQARARVRIAEAQVVEAQARVAGARADLQRMVDPDTGGDGPELAAAVERWKQAQEQRDKARVDLDRLTVRAPVDSRVLQLNLEPGEYAPASTSDAGLVVLGRDDPPQLRVEIDEVDIARFGTTARAWASPRGAADQRLDLKFDHVEPLVQPKTNLSGASANAWIRGCCRWCIASPPRRRSSAWASSLTSTSRPRSDHAPIFFESV